MATFEALGDFLSPTLELPVGGTTYVVVSPPARLGLRIQAVAAIKRAQYAGEEPADSDIDAFYDGEPLDTLRASLGAVYEQMLADGVSIEALRHAGNTAFVWIVAGTDAAREHWTNQGKALAAS